VLGTRASASGDPGLLLTCSQGGRRGARVRAEVVSKGLRNSSLNFAARSRALRFRSFFPVRTEELTWVALQPASWTMDLPVRPAID
jgi:hypothetical protein